MVIPGALPPILSEDEANQLRIVQDLYRERPMQSHVPGAGTWTENKAKAKRSGRYSASTNHLLAGYVFCAACGGRLHGATHGKDREHANTYLCEFARTRPHPESEGGVMISGICLEDAVLRVMRHVLQEPPAAEKKTAPKRKAPLRTLLHVQNDIDKLMDLHFQGILNQQDFSRRYEVLQEEAERLREVEAQPAADSLLDAAQELAAQGEELTREQLRQLMALVVERVEAPVVQEGVYVRGPRTGLRRHARVHLRFPTNEGTRTFLVPIYTTRYTGLRVILPEPDSEPDPLVVA